MAQCITIRFPANEYWYLSGQADSRDKDSIARVIREAIRFYSARESLPRETEGDHAMTTPMTHPLYAHDFYAWTQEQAALLREGAWGELDRSNLAEEVESLGARDRRELHRRLQRLVAHLLKWAYQPSKRQTGRSWRSTIRTQRQEIAMLLEQSPSLHRTVPAALDARYASARADASDQTRLPLDTFPDVCPWAADQVLDETFFPEI